MLNSNFIITLYDKNENIVMSFIDFKDIHGIKDFNSIIEDLILKPHLKFLTVIKEKKDITSQLLLLLYYFSLTRHINIIYKSDNEKKIIKKNIVENNKLNIEFENL